MNIQQVSPQRAALSPREFAFASTLSPSTVQRRINSGDIKSTKVGRRRLIPVEELERLMRVNSAPVLSATEGAQ